MGAMNTLLKFLRNSVRGALVLGFVQLRARVEGEAQTIGLRGQIPAAEYNALLDLYNSAGGPFWYQSRGWTNPASTTWAGVAVNAGHVAAIDLRENNLVGTIPTSLGNLPELSGIYMNGNGIGGTIPSSFGNLRALVYLWLQDNELRGGIPDGLGNLSATLFSLRLENNYLTGSIPSSLGSLPFIGELRLSNNQLSGTIPSSLGNDLVLQDLELDNNQLTGSIPSNLGTDFNLKTLLLDNNQLSGTIPVSLTNTEMLTMDFSCNQLSGDVPNFSGFKYATLYLGTNYLNIAPGSPSWSNIQAMIYTGNLVYYTQQSLLPPIILGPVQLLSGGAAQVGLTGLVGSAIEIQTSADLANWADLASLVLTNDTGQFLDPTAAGFPKRFYRAVVPP
jgi:hypothetical protein